MALAHEPITYRGKKVDFALENPEEMNIPIEELSEHLGSPSTPRTKRLKENARWKHAAAGEFVDEGVRAGIERMRLIRKRYIKTIYC